MLRLSRIPRARTQDAQIIRFAIHEACRVSHQLGAIRLFCGDSNHCVLSEESVPGICVVASERVRMQKSSRRNRELKTYQKTTGVRRTSHNCKVVNFRSKGARNYRASSFSRYLCLSMLPPATTRCKIFGRVTFRVRLSLVIFAKSYHVPINFDCIVMSACSLSISDIL